MVSWVPPGITSRNKRHFSCHRIASAMSDNRDYVNHIHLHTRTIPPIPRATCKTSPTSSVLSLGKARKVGIPSGPAT